MTATGETLMDTVPTPQGTPYAVGGSRGNFLTSRPRTPVAASAGPVPQSVAPPSGPNGGGTSLTITGVFPSPLAAVNPVTIGGGPVSSVVKVNNTTITCVTFPTVPGAKDVVVTDDQGRSGTLTNGYTFT